MLNEKLSIPESKHYCEYACSQSSSGFVAKLLELQPSRISEIKNGTRYLTKAEGEILRTAFGIPSQNPGQFCHATVLDDDQLSINYKPGSGESYLMHLLRFVNNSSNLSLLLKSFNLERKTLSTDREVSDKDKLVRLNELINTKEFLDLAYEALEPDCPMNGKVGIASLVAFSSKQFGINFEDSRAQQLEDQLLLISQIKETLDENYFPSVTSLNEKFELGKMCVGPLSEDIVINGKTVWKSRDNIELEDTENYFPLADWNYSPNDYIVGKKEGEWHSSVNSRAASIYLAPYSSVQFSLIWSESYNYFIKVGLCIDPLAMVDTESCPKTYDHIIVKVSKADQVFMELLKVFQFFGVKEMDIDKIKEIVALGGGFIPNAKYIS